MPFCSNCGKELKEDVKFCPSCGKEQPKNENTDEYKEEKFNDYTSVEDKTGDFDRLDISKNTVYAVLAYIGPLVLVPILAAPKSKFARFHANQGLVIFICGIALSLIRTVISALFRFLFPLNILRGIALAIISLIGLFLFVISIMGIVYSAQGKAKELPIIGKIKLL